jgi:dCMP deaminase
MKPKFIDLYMDFAERVAQMSYAVRLKVGAIIVKDDSVISYGYNGTPSGWPNVCEDVVYCHEGNLIDENNNPYKLVTKPEVLHAEMNSLMKLAKKSNGAGHQASMFITHAPCMECAKGIYQAGIKEVYYGKEYRSVAGLEFLRRTQVTVIEIPR